MRKKKKIFFIFLSSLILLEVVKGNIIANNRSDILISDNEDREGIKIFQNNWINNKLLIKKCFIVLN